MLKILPKTLKTAALAGTIGLAAAACNSGSQTQKFETQKQERIELSVKPSVDSLDLTKPNLPKITQDQISYKNSEGKIVTIKNSDSEGCAVGALYSAILKMSTPQKPNIEDTDKFFVEVEKNIKKYPAEGSSHFFKLRETLSNIQASTLFAKLFDMFTSPDSDSGKTITVQEYTHMMEAWSSTQPK